MIPKKIHYCWFGKGKKPRLAKKCIASWKKFCPDYEIIEWNEDNFNIKMNSYTTWCYENKKWAFLSDYVRLIVVRDNGGIYLDTDVEVIKSFDNLLELDAFFGFETDNLINTGLGFGACKMNPVMQVMLDEYSQLSPATKGTIGCPLLNTAALSKCGVVQNGKLQRLNNATVFPTDYFNPYDDARGILKKTKNTYSIHWYGKSWMSKWSIVRSTLTKPLHRLFGVDFFNKKRLK